MIKMQSTWQRQCGQYTRSRSDPSGYDSFSFTTADGFFCQQNCVDWQVEVSFLRRNKWTKLFQSSFWGIFVVGGVLLVTDLWISIRTNIAKSCMELTKKQTVRVCLGRYRQLFWFFSRTGHSGSLRAVISIQYHRSQIVLLLLFVFRRFHSIWCLLCCFHLFFP